MSLPRYPEYRDSGVEWLGEIPGHWETARIRRLTGLGMGQTILREMLEEGPSSDALPVYSASEGEAPFGYFKNPAVRLSKGDLIIGARGSIGMARVVTQESTCTQTTIWVKVATPSLVPEFAYWSFVGGREGLFPFDKTAIPMLTVEQVASGAVPLPPIHEQVEIASFLGRETAKIDALIAEQEKLLALLAEKRQATISHAVTRGLDPTAPLKDSGIPWLGEVPAHWEVLPLKRDLAFLTSGSRGWAEHYADEGALFLRIGNLTRNSVGLDLTDIQRVAPPQGSEGERTRVEPGDVLFSITAYLGSVAVVPDELETAYVSQHVALARLCGGLFLSKWVGFATLSRLGTTYLASQGYGGTKVQLSLDDIACLPITAPPLSEQKAIVDNLERELEKFEKVRFESEMAVDLLRERRSALIAAAVTGQMDVRGVVEPQAA